MSSFGLKTTEEYMICDVHPDWNLPVLFNLDEQNLRQRVVERITPVWSHYPFWLPPSMFVDMYWEAVKQTLTPQLKQKYFDRFGYVVSFRQMLSGPDVNVLVPWFLDVVLSEWERVVTQFFETYVIPHLP